MKEKLNIKKGQYQFQKTHGLHRSPTYQTWCGMKQRCGNPNHSKYADYGGRGISFPKKWESFEGFLEDMGERPKGMSLDRIDNSQSYSKENCKWATKREQNLNRRDTVFLEYKGESKPREVWAGLFGLKSATVHSRLRRGWSIVDALETPLKGRGNLIHA